MNSIHTCFALLPTRLKPPLIALSYLLVTLATLSVRAQITDQQAINFVKNSWNITDLTDDVIIQTLNTSYSGIPFKEYVSYFTVAPEILGPLANGDFSTAGKKAADFAADHMISILLKEAGLDGVVAPARMAVWPIEHGLNMFLNAVLAASFKNQILLYFAARSADHSYSEIINLPDSEVMSADPNILGNNRDIITKYGGWLAFEPSYTVGPPGYDPSQFFDYAEQQWNARAAVNNYNSAQKIIKDAFREAATPGKPTITKQPQDAVVTIGQTATFTVAATGAEPFVYVWEYNGTPFVGPGYGSSFTASIAGQYRVLVYDVHNLFTASRIATLTISSDKSSTITSVDPPVLPTMPLPQTQLLHIYGTGFTTGSTLLFNGNIPSEAIRLHFINSNHIDYDIKVGTTPASWNVRVINGSQESNLGYFTVASTQPANGSLIVTLLPVGAVSAGAQWAVDNGTYHNSDETVPGLTPGLHNISFKPIASFSTPSSRPVTINSGSVASDTGVYTVIPPSTYTLTLNQGGGVMGYIVNQPFGSGSGNSYNADAVVQPTANANFGYHFVSWGGDASGSANPTTIRMNGNKAVFANFASGDPNLGTMIVTIEPPEAAAAGVTWGFNERDFRASGSSYSFYPETVLVYANGVNGWVGTVRWVTLVAGQTTNVTLAASSTTGSIIGSDPRAYSTFAGLATNSGSADGIGSAARFYRPWSLAVDKGGNIYVADSWNGLIRKISPSGVVTTLAGKAGVSGYADGQGSNAMFNNPVGIAVDSNNNIFVADFMNSAIRKITPDGTVSTFAGLAGSNDSVDATGSAARFYFPAGIAVDLNGNVYVADSVNQTIRKITPNQVVTTLAGFPRSYGSVDATGSAARFHNPGDVAVDSSGNVYVADNENQTIRKVTPDGVVTTLAGYPKSGGTADGTGTTARFKYPSGVALDAIGNIYVADTGNNVIRKVTQSGVVTTLAGQSGNIGNADGIGSMVRFNDPSDVVVDSAGNLFIADAMNLTIRTTQSTGKKYDQTIAFGNLPDKYINDQPFSLNAVASSALPITFSIVSGPATLNGSIVTLMGAGIVTVRASQAGDVYFNAAVNCDRSFTVTKLAQTISFGPLSPQKVGDAPFPLSASSSSGLPVSYSLVSGPAVLSGNIVTLTGGGTVVVRASQGGDAIYAVAANVEQSFDVTIPRFTITASAGPGGSINPNGSIAKNAGERQDFSASPNPYYEVSQWLVEGSIVQSGGNSYALPNIQANQSVQVTFVHVTGNATVTLGALSQTYDGTAKAVTATTVPAGLAVAFTYDGLPNAPINAGNYAVLATVNDPNYQGGATGTLVIGKATASVTLGGLSQIYDGVAKMAVAATAPVGLEVNVTYNGATSAPVNAGSYTVIGTVNNPNYQGNATGSLVIGKAPATVILGNLTQAYDGVAKAVTVVTAPAGLTVDLTYNGAPNAPVNAGNYAVAAVISNPNYQGSATGTLSIDQPPATVTLGNLSQVYDGTAKTATVTTAPPGLPVITTYNGSPNAPVNAGRYAVVVTVNNPNYPGNATGTLVVAKAPATVVLSDLSQTFDGLPKVATVSTTPTGLNVNLSYNGSYNEPVKADIYIIIAVIEELNYQGNTGGTMRITQPAPTPTIALDRSANFITIGWATIGFKLQSSPAMPATNWQDVPGSETCTSVRIPIGTDKQFYRVK